MNLPVVAINADFLPTDVESLQLEAPDRFNALLMEAVDTLPR